MNISSSLKNFIRTSLPWSVYWWLKRFREECLVILSGKDLTSLALIYKTDKWGRHFYTPVYRHWFGALRYKPVRLLEIGTGGYARPHQGGNSLRMWKSYFPHGIITGIDIHDKSALQERRVHIYSGDQSDPDFLKRISGIEGPFDIIIDDGSHMQSHIIASFETLFPLMEPGGTYVIEDTQTSYWPKFEGSTKDMDTIPSAMNYFIKRVHEVNRIEWKESDRQVDEIGQMIETISFYHNLIIIGKQLE